MTKRGIKERLLRIGRRYYPDAKLSVPQEGASLSLSILMPYAPGKFNGWVVSDKYDDERTTLNNLLRMMKQHDQKVLRELSRKGSPLVVNGTVAV